MLVLVMGATGQLGLEICVRLDQANRPFRALVRPGASQSKVGRLFALGAEVVIGERRDRRALDEACDGVDVVVAAASAALSRAADESLQTFDREALVELVEAADQAGVRHFIYVGIPGNFAIAAPVSDAQQEVERLLRASGMTYTIIHPSYVMESWLSPAVGFDPAQATARIFGSGDQKISWVSRADVAQLTVDCIDNPSARNAVVRIGGPEALSPLEVVHTFEEVSGRAFRVQRVLDEAVQQLRATATGAVEKSFATLLLGYAQGDVVDMDDTCDRFGLELQSVREYARRVTRPSRPAAGAPLVDGRAAPGRDAPPA